MATEIQLSGEDFCEISQERKDLIEELAQALNVQEIPTTFWAMLHVCEVDKLRRFIKWAKDDETTQLVWLIAGNVNFILQTWTQKSGGQEEVESTPTAEALERDDNACIVTGDTTDCKVYHIFPWCMIQDQEVDEWGKRHFFWSILKSFWSVDKVAAWQLAVLPNGIHAINVETTANLITMSGSFHNKWKRGDFALKPVHLSEDKKTMKVVFVWQRRLFQKMPSSISSLETALSTRNLDADRSDSVHVMQQRKTGTVPKFLRSGDVITLTTPDPVIMPLPSYELLEMQFNLQRILGMIGAKYHDEDETDDEYDDASDTTSQSF